MAIQRSSEALCSFRAGYRMRCATLADQRDLKNREERLGFECADARAQHGAKISRVDSLRLTEDYMADWL